MDSLSDIIRIAAVRRLLAGSAKLLSGNLVASAIGLVSFALCARSLGVQQYGVLLLIGSGITLADRLVNFQSWQALIRFGSEPWMQRRCDRVTGLLRACFLLDVATAVLAFVVANAAIRIGAARLGWSAEVVGLATWYSVALLFNWSGLPIAVLRMAGRYELLAMQAAAAALIRLAAVALAVTAEAGLRGFVFAWFVSEILGYLSLFVLGLWEMHGRELFNARPQGVREVLAGNPGLIRFLVVTNLQISVRLGTTEADTMIVGGALGPGAAGLYGVVKKLSRLVSIALSPLYHAVYPELTRAHFERDRDVFRALVLSSTKIMAVASLIGWCLFLVAGRPLLLISVGPEYVGAFHPLLVYLVGVGLSMASFAYQPAMLALGKAEEAFGILLWSTALYLILLVIMTRHWGVIGACGSYVMFYCIWTGWMYRGVTKGIQEWQPASSSGAAGGQVKRDWKQ